MHHTTVTMRNAADKMEADTRAHSVLVGFDGFVDKILHLVDERFDQDRYRRMECMDQFAQRVAAAAGFSANIEMVPQQIKLGGNGPIMADGLHHMGCRVTYMGAIGAPNIHPVFSDFAAACQRVISIAEPAHTDALEFVDGKLMMGEMLSLKEVHWDNLCRRLPETALTDILHEVDLIGCVNWTMLPAMNSILKGFGTILERSDKRVTFFVDLTDPRKRPREDIREVLDILSGLQASANVVLGLNEQESAQVAAVLLDEADMDLRHRAIRIREALAISAVVIHPVQCACVADGDGAHTYAGPYTPKPKLTTGAGDTFNAGFCRGLLSGLTPEEAIGSGMCASGFYVRNARPPTCPELIAFMRAWAQADCGTLP